MQNRLLNLFSKPLRFNLAYRGACKLKKKIDKMADRYTEDLKTLNEEVNLGLDRFGLNEQDRKMNYIRTDILIFAKVLIRLHFCAGVQETALLADWTIGGSQSSQILMSCLMITITWLLVILNLLLIPQMVPMYNIFYYETKGTHAGYGKLRKENTDEYLSTDVVNARVQQYAETKMKGIKKPERHGPSASVAYPGVQLNDGSDFTTYSDEVRAYPVVDGWPQCFRRWFHRERRHGWPTVELMRQIFQNGWHVVPVGHKNSSPAQQRYEWRVSTVLAERVLVRSFNDTQHRTHFILKYIKNCIEKKLGVSEGLTSYHIKTLILWMVEDNSAEMWQRDNLIQCIKKCIGRLIDWFNEGKVPYYFMPENNLIDAIPSGLQGSISAKLEVYFENLTEQLQAIKELPQQKVPSLTLMLTTIENNVSLFSTPVEQENMQKCCRFATNKSVGKQMYGIIEAQKQHILGCDQHLCALSEQGESRQQSYFKKAEELLLSSVDLDMSANKLKLANFYYSRGLIAKDKGNKRESTQFFQSAEKYTSLALEKENVKHHLFDPKGTWIPNHDLDLLYGQTTERTIDRILEKESGLATGPKLVLWVLKNRRFCLPVYYPKKYISTLPKPVQFVLQAANESYFGERPFLFIHPVVFGHFLRVLCALETLKTQDVCERIREFQQACDDLVKLSYEKAIGYALLGQLYQIVNNQSDAFKCFVRSYHLWPIADNCALWLIFLMYGESRTPTNHRHRNSEPLHSLCTMYY